jgi:hypothetical protein
MVNATIAAPMPTAKTMVTTSPDVVSESSRFIHTFAPAVSVKQIKPAAQEEIAVVVDEQVIVFPPETEQAVVETVDVTEQASVPVVVAAAAVPVDVDVVVVLVLEVEDAVEAELALDPDVVAAEAEVVVAEVLATLAVEDLAVEVFAVVLFAVATEDSVADVEEPALLFNSFPTSCTSTARQSSANQTASAFASANSHPPATKHISISPSRARFTPVCRHLAMLLLRPQFDLAASSLMLSCAHPVAETMATDPRNARRVERIFASETTRIEGRDGRQLRSKWMTLCFLLVAAK